jgi:hypothetical protein
MHGTCTALRPGPAGDGRVIASTADEAIEAAAVEFNTDA